MDKISSQENKTRAHIGKMEARINHWGAKLGALAAQADSAEVAVVGGFHQHIDVLILKHQAARSKLEELRSAGSEGYEALSKTLDTFWNELEGGIKDLNTRFKDALLKKSIEGVSRNGPISEKADDR